MIMNSLLNNPIIKISKKKTEHVVQSHIIYFCSTSLSFLASSENAVTIPARFCSSLGIIIFVDFPSATFSNVSIPFSDNTSFVGAASFNSFNASACAF